ncbi:MULTISPECIES: class I SAM-dependent methyltransferase [Okeania]|uniref:Methyltransferase domain-containing protein n=1 Tax=Okeania hirsuta TaxID=1458930 RepID=A0A3N6P696_9CYAN|nr:MULTISPECIES: class I SAM-dependent methyltransferase [Okeania]NET14843.1 methyltransferase domain-containing protein [Okeania sp. SIO1H6]NES79541.1 methyltransferase domain-containing protein [Okeania sp. SIO1H4]NES93057.1 methyltransferase domain-containing protein [Okeania sp. SIO2B9]NET23196.1 methyltransferase domain-containing protein [Okeania sp. SIO1H5]NET96684.1 methyltransferase domain-containing protein [Okeania sp. SIO1H2]
MEPTQLPEAERAFKYFDLYGSMRAHKIMLEDMARMEAYHSAIFKNKSEMIADKVVLDVGTGTGVLAVWAAKAGAKQVYAVDASNAAKLARRLVQSSNVSDVVTILNSKVEEVEIPEPVDVIVSEWMGCFLLKESMFDSVAYARDKWLKPGGLMLPSRATILLGLYAPGNDSDRTNVVKLKLEKEIAEWKETVSNLQSLDVDYSGFTSEVLQDLSDYFLTNSMRVNYLSPDDLASAPQKVLEFDCATVDPTILVQFSQDFEYTISKHAEIKGFLGWFTTDFPNGVVLDTGPGKTYSHWGQQLYPLKESLKVAPGDRVVGTISVSRDPHEPRFNVVELKYQVNTGLEQTALFNVGHVQHLDEGSKNVFG